MCAGETIQPARAAQAVKPATGSAIIQREDRPVKFSGRLVKNIFDRRDNPVWMIMQRCGNAAQGEDRQLISDGRHFTVPITTRPVEVCVSLAARIGRNSAMPPFIALAAERTSGTNKMPSAKSRPTMHIASTRLSLRIRFASQPRSSRIYVPSAISGPMPSYRSSFICSTRSSSGRSAKMSSGCSLMISS